MLYSMKDLCSVSGTTPQSIHKLFKSNKELKALLEANTITEGRNKLYTQEVYDWFCRRYSKPLMENSDTVGDFENAAAEIPNITPAPVKETEAEATEAESLKADLAAKQAELEEKEAAIADLEQLNNSLTQENTALKATYQADLEAKDKEIAAIQADLKATAAILEGKTAEVEGLIQARDSLTGENTALRGHFEALEGRIAAQEQELRSKQEQIERLIVSNNALSITVNRAQTERLLAEAKKQNIFVRIKNKLFGGKAPSLDTVVEPTEDSTADN